MMKTTKSPSIEAAIRRLMVGMRGSLSRDSVFCATESWMTRDGEFSDATDRPPFHGPLKIATASRWVVEHTGTAGDVIL